jgi:hypothetical protein
MKEKAIRPATAKIVTIPNSTNAEMQYFLPSSRKSVGVILYEKGLSPRFIVIN